MHWLALPAAACPSTRGWPPYPQDVLAALRCHPRKPTLQTYGCVVLLSFVAVIPDADRVRRPSRLPSLLASPCNVPPRLPIQPGAAVWCGAALLTQLKALAIFKRRRAEFNSSFAEALVRRDEHVTNAYIKVQRPVRTNRDLPATSAPC